MKMIEKRVAALGFFDGVHIGHAALLKRVIEISRETGLNPSVITFDTLPQNFFGSDYIMLINSIEDRIGCIRRMFGIDNVICLPFDRAMAIKPWDDFIDTLIIDYDIRHFVTGENFRFGKGASGSSKLLNDMCRESGFGCDIITSVMHDSIVCSSTNIRELLLQGDIELANAFLGHNHVLSGIVRSGQRIGRTLGKPTINMHFPNGVLVPAFGVYATKVYIENNTELYGVTNIGIRPTVDDSGLVTAETFIFDFEESLYDTQVRLEFCKYLRPEQKFSNTNELKKQIQKDCKAALNYFK